MAPTPPARVTQNQVQIPHYGQRGPAPASSSADPISSSRPHLQHVLACLRTLPSVVSLPAGLLHLLSLNPLLFTRVTTLVLESQLKCTFLRQAFPHHLILSGCLLPSICNNPELFVCLLVHACHPHQTTSPQGAVEMSTCLQMLPQCLG